MAKWHQRWFRRYVSAGDHPAKGRIMRWLWPWFVPDDGVMCEVSGVKLWLHPDDDIEGQLYRGIPYEASTIDFLRRNLGPGDTAIVAGVNTGFHLITAAQAVGERGTVVGVEPQPLSLHRAMRNIRANSPKAKIHLVSGGLGDAPSLVPMGEAPKDHTGWGSFVLRDVGRAPYQIQVLSYQSLVERLSLPPVRLMLLDVEGYELQVLRGMSAENCPEILLVEIHNVVLELTNSTPQQYFSAVGALGYDTWNMDGRPATVGEPIIDNNLVCVKRGARMPQWISN